MLLRIMQKMLSDFFQMQTLMILTAVAHGLVDIMRERTMFRQSAHFVEIIIIMRKNNSIVLDRKRRKLARLMLHRTVIQNVRLGNALDVDLKITLSQNVPSQQNIMRNGDSK